ncbi:PH domain-containing protein [Luteimicrobium sp. DT211]|uniref:PH domain-containing protein n=1 Tax=Luteimicrobium sp. DT211 TaxID=3393412 RepID=UPI003CEBACE5
MSSGRAAVRTSYRPRSSAWLTGASWALLVGVGATQTQVGGGAGGLRAAPWVLGLGYLAWLVFWRPRLDVRDDAVVAVNPFRTVEVPWAALIDVGTQYALTLVTPHGRYRAWAAPGPGRHRALTAGPDDLTGLPRNTFDGKQSAQMGDLRGTPSGTAGELVRAHWQGLVESGALEAGVADATPVTVRWDRVPVVLLAVCLALGVGAQLL